MNGPENYREAERLTSLAQDELSAYADSPSGSRGETYHFQQAQVAIANAQVHATLALAAATALGVAQGPMAAETKVAREWREVLS